VDFEQRETKKKRTKIGAVAERPTKSSVAEAFFPEEVPGLALEGEECGRLSSVSVSCSGCRSRSRDAGGSGSQRPQQETTVGVTVSWNLNPDIHEVWPRVDGRAFGLANQSHG
jgi:hypothetical protein